VNRGSIRPTEVQVSTAFRTDRRAFVQAMLAAIVGTRASFGSPMTFQAPAVRRQVTLGGRRIKVVDGHAHCVIPVQHITRGTSLEKMGGGAGNNLLGPERLQIMDQQGVDVQALTINNFWWYAASDVELARRINLEQNEGLAKWVAQHPDRFVATAAVSLQHPELAAEQLRDGVKRLGLRGASIGCHVNGDDLSLPKFDPFWAAAAELGVPVFTATSSATRSRPLICCRA
jgi:aminocarboxymuconate-semialdehyde decarboxylase